MSGKWECLASKGNAVNSACLGIIANIFIGIFCLSTILHVAGKIFQIANSCVYN